MLKEVFSFQINKVDENIIIDANTFTSHQYLHILDFQLGTPVEFSNGFRY